jgi:hypothetical protein
MKGIERITRSLKFLGLEFLSEFSPLHDGHTNIKKDFCAIINFCLSK